MCGVVTASFSSIVSADADLRSRRGETNAMSVGLPIFSDIPSFVWVHVAVVILIVRHGVSSAAALPGPKEDSDQGVFVPAQRPEPAISSSGQDGVELPMYNQVGDAFAPSLQFDCSLGASKLDRGVQNCSCSKYEPTMVEGRPYDFSKLLARC